MAGMRRSRERKLDGKMFKWMFQNGWPQRNYWTFNKICMNLRHQLGSMVNVDTRHQYK